MSTFADRTFTAPERIRNFCIIAHIDHGKSTLADRMLQFTGVVDERNYRAQYLDRMDIERERGITIKAQNVRLPWKVGETEHVLHLIDTPGHVDFTYEVSRALEACEGAILLVDAAQGIEAQTLANLYLALEKDLTIIPVLNKIDLPAADPDRYAAELAHIVGCEPDDVLRVSAKTGSGVRELLNEVVRLVPAPVGDADAPARAMIFDSVYDTYRGVITYIRVVDGRITPRERIKMMSTGAVHELLEVGIVSPDPKPSEGLGVGEVGYLITGVKDVRQSKVGDTVTSQHHGATEALTGYREPRPMVYSGLYPVEGSDYPELREALDKLQLNDAALTYEPETSTALGFGFRCGFLGLLHLEITRDRLEREAGLDLISTAPNVVYRVVLDGPDKNGATEMTVTNPSDWPTGRVVEIHEPIVKTTILAPSEFIGAIMELCQARRGVLGGMDYLSETRVELRYTMPLAEIIFDFFDALKSRTRGYASLDYEEAGEQAADLVKIDILLQGEPVDAFSAIRHRDSAYAYGTTMASKLRELIPRQQFEVPIQAAIGSRVIARENIRAMR
ncbi:MAG TPA: translation elongation factor 4, partial [Pseudonocardia sp.]|nr:translation elongation factor 4 [Pseudonocardia sp.]